MSYFISIAELLAMEWRDGSGWPLDHLTRLNRALEEAEAGRWIMTGVPCGPDGEPAGEGDRQQILAGEVARLHFPLAVPPGQKYDLFAPAGRAYAEIRIARKLFRVDDDDLLKSYLGEKGKGSQDDFAKWATERGSKSGRTVLRQLYQATINRKGKRGRPPPGR